MNKILQNSILASNLSKTVLYSIEFKLLMRLSKTFSFFVKPPKEENDKNLVKHLQEGVIKLHKEDARNIDEGYYPLDVIKPKSPLIHLKNLPYVIYDSLKISRRRKLNRKKDLEDGAIRAPEFDLVFSVYLFHELPKDMREKVLSESHRVLKNDGVFAFCD